MEPKKRERLIDDLLDSALKQYGAAEPRAGLEDRVLAAMQAEGRRVESRTWSWWPAAIACALLLLSISAALLVRNHHRDTSAAKSHAPAASAARPSPEQARGNVPEKESGKVTAKANPRGLRDGHPRQSGVHGPSQPPHMEQFPSPRPLSEQEILLARLVEQFPREAAMIARAQTRLLAQEEEEEKIERQTPSEKEVPQNLQEQNP